MKKRLSLKTAMVAAAFICYVLVTCYKLTNAPLWFDETIEFWYSKIMIGKLPFDGEGLSGSTNMYQRIISTFQPPLYNCVMYFWLKLGTSEWWFRSFGVIMGFVANAGIYKTVKKVSNVFIAVGSVFFASFVFRLVYYWQECAEYGLMLALLCWTFYGFICLLEIQSTGNIILFTVLSVLSVYSQYGAVFPVFAMAVIAYVYVVSKKEKRPIISLTAAYLVALTVAAVPLVFFFLLRQMANQQGRTAQPAPFAIDGGLFSDMFHNLKTTFSWCFFSYYGKWVTVVFVWILLCSMIIVLLFSFRMHAKLLALVNIMTWMSYYGAVKLGLYAYGSFGSRYNLFFIPLWIISACCFGYEIYTFVRKKIPGNGSCMSCICSGICLCLLVCFMYSSWTMKLQYNWKKEDMRSAVNAWLDAGAQTSNTIVYYGGDSGFAYYLREKENYSEELEKNVTYMNWFRDKTVAEYTEYVNSIYGQDWPDEVYIIGTHARDDINTLAEAFTDKGYTRQDLCTDMCSLMRLSYDDKTK